MKKDNKFKGTKGQFKSFTKELNGAGLEGCLVTKILTNDGKHIATVNATHNEEGFFNALLMLNSKDLLFKFEEAYDFIRRGANTHSNKERVELEESMEALITLIMENRIYGRIDNANYGK